jgi:signal transduction histidine kinase
MHSSKFIHYFAVISSSVTAFVFFVVTAIFMLSVSPDMKLYVLHLCLWIGSVISSSAIVILAVHHPLRSLRILTAFYYLVGSVTAFFFENTLTISLIAFSICILVGSLSFGRRFSLIGAIACVSTLFGVYWFVVDRTSDPYTYDALLTQSLLLTVVALFCWHSLQVADTYYRRFGKKLDDLTHRIETYETRIAQENQAELLMLYKFADAGRKSVAILHNLANHLTLMALDDNGRYRQSYEELNSLMADAYASLRPVEPTAFDPFELLTKETVPALRDIADIHSVKIECIQSQEAANTFIHGDRFQLGLAVTILVHNAIDSYRSSKRDVKDVIISVSTHNDRYIITVDDNGPGIPMPLRKKLFQSRTGTDSNCHGIGLFTAREIISSHFNGDLTLDQRRDMTRFTITLPITPTLVQKEVATASN